MTYEDEVLADNPVAYYPMDETSGSTLNDKSGNGYDGTMYNSPSLDQPGFNRRTRSIFFNGSDQRVDVYTEAVSSKPETIEAWARHTGDQSVSGSSSIVNDREDNGVQLTLGYNRDGWQFAWEGEDDGYESIFDGSSFTQDEWAHLVATHDGSTARLYVDGTEVASYTGKDFTPRSSGECTIAASDNYPPSERLFNGYISGVAIYDYELSASRIQDHYVAAKAVPVSADMAAAGSLSAESALASVRILLDGGVVEPEPGASIRWSLGERGEATFAVVDFAGDLSVELNQRVDIVAEDGSALFAGVVDRAPLRLFGPGGALRWEISAVDWAYTAAKRVVAKVYEEETAGDIVFDLHSRILSDEDVSLGNVETGPIVSRAAFNYVSVEKALDALAERAGFHWRIDADRKLHFAARDANAAPWSIAPPYDDVDAEMALERRAPKYRNRQIISGGKDTTALQTETFPADGSTKTFSVGYPIAQKPTVEVDGTAQSVGIRGVSDSDDFYWSKGDNAVTQDQSASPVASGSDVKIDYRGLFHVVAISEDDEESDRVAALDGTSGIVDATDEANDATDRMQAFERAAQKLDRFAVVGGKLTFRSRRGGLRHGQLLSVTVPPYGLDGAEFLIDQVKASISVNGSLGYKVQAVQGPVEGSWTKFFSSLASGDGPILENLQEEEVVVVLHETSDKASWSGTTAQDPVSCPVFSFSLPATIC
jgi:hypothetical protein